MRVKLQSGKGGGRGKAYGEEVEGDLRFEGVPNTAAPFCEEVVEQEGIVL